ncbi:MAG: DNA-3-methyladenine glycosylase [Candidatus Binatia bacterium]
MSLAAPLARSFYDRPTLRVARDLLGCLLVHCAAAEPAVGIIVEVEAYCGPRDLACHSAGGRRTARNEVMYGPPGHAYVYFTYGMHNCLNVVTRAAGIAEAILIRAVAPTFGLGSMRARRQLSEKISAFRLARGPGNLCRAFGIDRTLNGADLTASALTIRPARSFAASEVRRTARIGIDYAGAYVDKPWRLCVRDEPAVSGRR